MQVIADEHLGRNQTAISAVAAWLEKWYSPNTTEVAEFMAEAGNNPGKVIAHQSKKSLGTEKIRVEVTYYPPDFDAPDYVNKLTKKGKNQNRWDVNTTTWTFED